MTPLACAAAAIELETYAKELLATAATLRRFASTMAGEPTVRVTAIINGPEIATDQSASNSDRWVRLGRFEFGYGRDPARSSVTLDASGATGTRVVSDAVLFRLASLDAEYSAGEAWRMYD